MKYRLVLLAPALVPLSCSDSPSPRQPAAEAARAGTGGIGFEQNVGQTSASYDFVARAQTYIAGIGPNEVGLKALVRDQSGGTVASARMTLVDSSSAAVARPGRRLPSLTAYFKGSAGPSLGGIPSFSSVEYPNIYPGIDIRYYGSDRRLEFDLVIHPGAGVGDAVFSVAGTDPLVIGPAGELFGAMAVGTLVLSMPRAFVLTDQGQEDVAASYEIVDQRTFRIQVGDYDRSKTLVIDPVIDFTTLLGGSGTELNIFGDGIVADAAGDVVVAGATASVDFPATVGVVQGGLAGQSDGFVAKVRDGAGGSTLVFATYLGGSADDRAFDLDVDAAGNVVVVGTTTSTDFPVLSPHQPTIRSGDTFVTKISGDGQSLLWSTFFGGDQIEGAPTVAIDTAGDIHVAFASPDPNPILASPGCVNVGAGPQAIVVAQFSASGTLSTVARLGGTGDQRPLDMAITVSDGLLLVGITNAPDFPAVNAFQPVHGGPGVAQRGDDGFVTRLSADCTSLQSSSFIGGADAEQALGVAVDNADNGYVVGVTQSPNFETTEGAFDRGPVNILETYVTKVAANGALVYSTFLGTDVLQGADIAVDQFGNVFVAGADDGDLPPIDPFQPAYGGGIDGFVVKMNATASALLFASFIGGSSFDEVHGIATDAAGNVYLAGATASVDFPTVAAFQGSFGGGLRDLFVAKVGALADFELLVQPRAVDFGAVDVGITVQRSVTVSNIGLLSTPVSSVTLAGDGDFSLSHDCPPLLIATCTVTVDYAPSRPGSATATVSILSDAPTSPDVIAISGLGIGGVNNIEALPGQVDFGDLEVGGQSESATVTVTNVGVSDVTIQVAVPLPSGFELVSDGCSMVNVSSSESCTVSLRFAPTSGPATIVGTLTFSATGVSGSPGSAAVNLSGRSRAPVLVFDPATLGFGNQPVLVSSDPMITTLSNEGNAALQAMTVSLATVSGAGMFSQALTGLDDCGVSVSALQPGESCRIGVRFTPNSIGFHRARLFVSGPPGPTIDSAELLGMAVSDADLRLSPASLGDVLQGLEAVRTVDLRNFGTVGRIRVDTIAPISSGVQLILNNCDGQLLDPGESCGLILRLVLDEPGPTELEFVVESSQPASPETLAVGAEVRLHCDGQATGEFAHLGEECSVGFGVCEGFGTVVCAPDNSSTACDAVPAAVPSFEICTDELDNDCNGLVDEGCPKYWVYSACIENYGTTCETPTAHQTCDAVVQMRRVIRQRWIDWGVGDLNFEDNVLAADWMDDAYSSFWMDHVKADRADPTPQRVVLSVFAGHGSRPVGEGVPVPKMELRVANGVLGTSRPCRATAGGNEPFMRFGDRAGDNFRDDGVDNTALPGTACFTAADCLFGLSCVEGVCGPSGGLGGHTKFLVLEASCTAIREDIESIWMGGHDGEGIMVRLNQGFAHNSSPGDFAFRLPTFANLIAAGMSNSHAWLHSGDPEAQPLVITKGANVVDANDRHTNMTMFNFEEFGDPPLDGWYRINFVDIQDVSSCGRAGP